MPILFSRERSNFSLVYSYLYGFAKKILTLVANKSKLKV